MLHNAALLRHLMTYQTSASLAVAAMALGHEMILTRWNRMTYPVPGSRSKVVEVKMPMDSFSASFPAMPSCLMTYQTWRGRRT